LGSSTRASRNSSGALRRSIDFVVEARYAGQVWELEVPVPRTTLDPSALAALVEAFHGVHERVFSVRDDASAVEFLAWRARLTVHLEHGRPRPADPAGTAPPRPFVVRPAYFPAVGEVETPFFAGPSLAAGDRVAGPAVVAEPTTTVVLPPGAAATQEGRRPQRIPAVVAGTHHRADPAAGNPTGAPPKFGGDGRGQAAGGPPHQRTVREAGQ